MFTDKLHQYSISLILGTFAFAVSGCASYPPWLANSGPSAATVVDAETYLSDSGIAVVNVTPPIANRLAALKTTPMFSGSLSGDTTAPQTISPGDVLEVSIWEAPPATLFSSAALTSVDAPPSGGKVTFPSQVVNSQGMISIPFAGDIPVKGHTAHKIQEDIAHALRNKANHPQVIVRVLENQSSGVTIVGEVNQSKRIPLSPKGERLLDALAEAGGTTQPVGKVTLQVARQGDVQALPLETIIADPTQNISLMPGDVITALYQPFSFSVLGAAGKNEEIQFKTQGISLAQALARAGGLQDNRSDSSGVFIFRFEPPENLELTKDQFVKTTENGKIPVIYRINLRDPATFFVAQNFPMKNKDVMYIANASGVELQKFLNMIFSGIYPTLTILNTVK
ncbi:MAG: polysaccharide biosynthesis/export family protein [bacterium]